MSERLAVSGLTSVGTSERRHIGALKLASPASVLRNVTLLVRGDTKAVHSVGVAEEPVLLGVLLHVAPATTLPTARHQVKLRVHLDLGIHMFEVSGVD